MLRWKHGKQQSIATSGRGGDLDEQRVRPKAHIPFPRRRSRERSSSKGAVPKPKQQQQHQEGENSSVSKKDNSINVQTAATEIPSLPSSQSGGGSSEQSVPPLETILCPSPPRIISPQEIPSPPPIAASGGRPPLTPRVNSFSPPRLVRPSRRPPVVSPPTPSNHETAPVPPQLNSSNSNNNDVRGLSPDTTATPSSLSCSLDGSNHSHGANSNIQNNDHSNSSSNFHTLTTPLTPVSQRITTSSLKQMARDDNFSDSPSITRSLPERRYHANTPNSSSSPGGGFSSNKQRDHLPHYRRLRALRQLIQEQECMDGTLSAPRSLMVGTTSTTDFHLTDGPEAAAAADEKAHLRNDKHQQHDDDDYRSQSNSTLTSHPAAHDPPSLRLKSSSSSRSSSHKSNSRSSSSPVPEHVTITVEPARMMQKMDEHLARRAQFLKQTKEQNRRAMEEAGSIASLSLKSSGTLETTTNTSKTSSKEQFSAAQKASLLPRQPAYYRTKQLLRESQELIAEIDSFTVTMRMETKRRRRERAELRKQRLTNTTTTCVA